MGSYFSLHDAAFWEQTIIEAPEPSIWSNVRHSPLALHKRILLERPGRVYYSPASGLRQGGTSLQISDSAEIGFIVGFEEAAGRLYAAVLLRAPESSPHRYGREMEEVVLSHPAAARSSVDAPSSTGSGGVGSPNATRQRPKQEPLEIEKLHQEKALQETGWPYMLLYAVKEGILVFFTEDVAECEEIVREVALSVGGKHPVPQDLTLSGGRASTGQPGMGGGTAAAANLQAALRVKVLEHYVGRAPAGATMLLTEMIMSDLKRDFAVRCRNEEQPDCTNCVIFCMRTAMAMQMAVRGYDIKRVCEDPAYKKELGPKAGEAACNAWEDLWRRVRP